LEKSRNENLSVIKEKALWPVTIAKIEEIYKKALEWKSG
jgi:hypothetical protein